jgi:fumarylacetoacetase
MSGWQASPAERLVGPGHPGLGIPSRWGRSWARVSRQHSSWIVTRDALEPFRRPVPAVRRGPALAELDSSEDRERGAYGITLEVWPSARCRRHRAAPGQPSRLRPAVLDDGQMVAHHIQWLQSPRRDPFGSGTVSGPTPERGCLLERNLARQ